MGVKIQHKPIYPHDEFLAPEKSCFLISLIDTVIPINVGVLVIPGVVGVFGNGVFALDKFTGAEGWEFGILGWC